MNKLGHYIYSVIAYDNDRTFDAVPIGGAEEAERKEARSKKLEAGLSSFQPPASCLSASVYTISHNGLAAVVSDSPVCEYPLTRENMLAHQKVNEAVMKEGFVVLPVKFCTIAEDTDLIVKRLLDGKREEIKEKLEYLAGKNEFGLKVIWKEMPQVFAAIVEENLEIKRFKTRLEREHPSRARDGMIEIGHMVKDALDAKKEFVGGPIFNRLERLAVEAKKLDVYGDRMVLNSVFLVEKTKEVQLDTEINKLAEEYKGMMDWKYVGPTPAANFVEIVVVW